MSKKCANYDFEDQKQPKRRMGQGDFADLPTKAIVRPFPRSTDYRSGVTNRFEKDVEVVSGITENNK